MWSYSFTGVKSRFNDCHRVGLVAELSSNISDGALFEIMKSGVDAGIRTWVCHQDALPVCRSLFKKVFTKERRASNVIPNDGDGSVSDNAGTSLPLPSSLGCDRKDCFIAIEFSRQLYQKKDVAGTIKAAVEGLGVGYVDLVLVPWPTEEGQDFVVEKGTADANTFRAMWRQVTEARARDTQAIRALGVVDLEVSQLESLLDPLDTGITYRPSVQYYRRLNLSRPRVHNVQFCHSKGMEVIARVVQGTDPPSPVTSQLAQQYGKTALEVLINWCLRRGMVVLPDLPSITSYTDVGGPDAYRTWRESLAKDLASINGLVHPLASKDPYYAPTAKHHFQLCLQDIERLNTESQDAVLHTPLPPPDQDEEVSYRKMRRRGCGCDSSALVRDEQAARQDVEGTIQMIQQERLPEGVVRAVVREEEGWEDRLLDKSQLEMGGSKTIREGEEWVEAPKPKGLVLQLFKVDKE